MKSDMGMDAPDTPASERRYESFKELAADVEGLVNTLWASATREFNILYMHYVVEVKIIYCYILSLLSSFFFLHLILVYINY